MLSLSLESKFGKEKVPNSEISYFVAWEKMKEIVDGNRMEHYHAQRLVSESIIAKIKPFPFLRSIQLGFSVEIAICFHKDMLVNAVK